MTIETTLEQILAAVNKSEDLENTIRRKTLYDFRRAAEALPDGEARAGALMLIDEHLAQANADRDSPPVDRRPMVDELPDDPNQANKVIRTPGQNDTPTLDPWDVTLQPAMRLVIQSLLLAAHVGACTPVEAYCAIMYNIWDLADAVDDPNLPTKVPKRYGRDVKELLELAQIDATLPAYQDFIGEKGVRIVRKMNAKRFVRAAQRGNAAIQGEKA